MKQDQADNAAAQQQASEAQSAAAGVLSEGDSAFAKGDYTSALTYYTTSLQKYTELEDEVQVAALLIKIAATEEKLAAQQAISEDGEWGVNAVATRIVDMCVSLSGGDSSKLDEMRAAVEKGFEQAGVQWGTSLPSICNDTHDEINKRFDYWEQNGSMDGYVYGVTNVAAK